MKKNFKQKYLLALLGVIASSVVVGCVSDVAAMQVFDEKKLNEIESDGQAVTNPVSTSSSVSKSETNGAASSSGSSSDSAKKLENSQKEIKKNQEEIKNDQKEIKENQNETLNSLDGKKSGKNEKKSSKRNKKNRKNKKNKRRGNGKDKQNKLLEKSAVDEPAGEPKPKNEVDSRVLSIPVKGAVDTGALLNSLNSSRKAALVKNAGASAVKQEALSSKNFPHSNVVQAYVEVLNDLYKAGHEIIRDAALNLIRGKESAQALLDKGVTAEMLINAVKFVRGIIYGVVVGSYTDQYGKEKKQAEGGINFNIIPIDKERAKFYYDSFAKVLDSREAEIFGNKGKINLICSLLADLINEVISAAKSNSILNKEEQDYISNYTISEEKVGLNAGVYYWLGEQKLTSELPSMSVSDIEEKLEISSLQNGLKILTPKEFKNLGNVLLKVLGPKQVANVYNIWISQRLRNYVEKREDGLYYWKDNDVERKFLSDLYEIVRKAYWLNDAANREQYRGYDRQAVELRAISSMFDLLKGHYDDRTGRYLHAPAADDIIKLFTIIGVEASHTRKFDEKTQENTFGFTDVEQQQLNCLADLLSRVYANQAGLNFVSNIYLRSLQTEKSFFDEAKNKVVGVFEKLKDNSGLSIEARNGAKKLFEIFGFGRNLKDITFSLKDEYTAAVELLYDPSLSPKAFFEDVKKAFEDEALLSYFKSNFKFEKGSTYTTSQLDGWLAAYGDAAKQVASCEKWLKELAAYSVEQQSIVNLIFLNSFSGEQYQTIDLTNGNLTSAVGSLGGVDASAKAGANAYTAFLADLFENIKTNFDVVQEQVNKYRNASEDEFASVMQKVHEKFAAYAVPLKRIYAYLLFMNMTVEDFVNDGLGLFSKYFAKGLLDQTGALRVDPQAFKSLIETYPNKKAKLLEVLTQFEITALKLAGVCTVHAPAQDLNEAGGSALASHYFGIVPEGGAGDFELAEVKADEKTEEKFLAIPDATIKLNTAAGFNGFLTPLLKMETDDAALSVVGDTLYATLEKPYDDASGALLGNAQNLVKDGNYWRFWNSFAAYTNKDVGYFGKFIPATIDAADASTTGVTTNNAYGIVETAVNMAGAATDVKKVNVGWPYNHGGGDYDATIASWASVAFTRGWLADSRALYIAYFAAVHDAAFNPSLTEGTDTFFARVNTDRSYKTYGRYINDLAKSTFSVAFNLPFYIQQFLNQAQWENGFNVKPGTNVSIKLSDGNTKSCAATAMWSKLEKTAAAVVDSDFVKQDFEPTSKFYHENDGGVRKSIDAIKNLGKANGFGFKNRMKGMFSNPMSPMMGRFAPGFGPAYYDITNSMMPPYYGGGMYGGGMYGGGMHGRWDRPRMF